MILRMLTNVVLALGLARAALGQVIDVDAGLVELQDGQFARLVDVLAEEIPSALDRAGLAPTAVCRAPEVTFTWHIDPILGPRFSGQLSRALQARLHDRLKFVPEGDATATLLCTVEFSAGSAEDGMKQMRFVLRRNSEERTLVALDFDYTPRTEASAPRPERNPPRPDAPSPRAAPPMRAPAPPPAPVRAAPQPEPSQLQPMAPTSPPERVARPARVDVNVAPRAADVDVVIRLPESERSYRRHSSKRLKIDLDADELALRIEDGLSGYDDQTVFEPTGRVVFLDNDDVKKYWITSVQARHRDNDHLRVEVSMRARGERRKAELRMVYLDGAGRPLSVSRVVSLRCPQSQTITAVFEASDPRAAGYVCLFKDD